MKFKIFSFVLSLLLVSCTPEANIEPIKELPVAESSEQIRASVDEFSPYRVINDNVPYFTKEDYTTSSYESYSPLDHLGRCGAAVANVGTDIMPTDERGAIGQIKPSGWQYAKYDHVDGKYLFNRCHLLGFQLTGENANDLNLITGTRYMNVEGMLPFENMVADYVRSTNNHVLLRVTPVFEGDNLVASGVTMEAYSIEDNGAGICFNVYCYNIQPGVIIDYATGESCIDENYTPQKPSSETIDYILNVKSKKIHLPSCSGVRNMNEKNKKEYHGSIDELKNQGYTPCGTCKPK